jgi:hypothetical protein
MPDIKKDAKDEAKKDDDFVAYKASGLCNGIDDVLMFSARVGMWVTVLWFNARYATNNPDLNETG